MAHLKTTAKKYRTEADESKKKPEEDVQEEEEPQPSTSKKRSSSAPKKQAKGSSMKTERASRKDKDATPEKSKKKRATSSAHEEKSKKGKTTHKPKHLERPRSPSPDAYISEAPSSSDDEADDETQDATCEGATGTTVEHVDDIEPPVGKSSPQKNKKWLKITAEQEELLIEFYKSNPIFYDKTHDRFLDTKEKTRLQNEKAASLELEGTKSSVICLSEVQLI